MHRPHAGHQPPPPPHPTGRAAAETLPGMRGESPWTTRRLLSWMGEAFTSKGLDSPRLLAEILMSHVIGCERLKLYTDPDRPANADERTRLRDLVARALKHEPVQYLVGEAWFFGMPFHVDPRVLIPRPATEVIPETILQRAQSTHGVGFDGAGLLILDVCTGSGCIAIATLKKLKAARAVASDINADAISLATGNAARHLVADRIEFIQGDMLAAFHNHPIAGRESTFDYVASNPPYIPDDEWDAVAPNVKDHEPHSALRGGPDGLEFVRHLLSPEPPSIPVPRLLKPGGMLLIEVADSRAEIAREMLGADPHLESPRVLKDHEGLPRVIVATRRE